MRLVRILYASLGHPKKSTSMDRFFHSTELLPLPCYRPLEQHTMWSGMCSIKGLFKPPLDSYIGTNK